MNQLVLGNPGTGKTHNLKRLIDEFIDKGYKSNDITILSHTRVAAKEIAERAKIPGVKASTIHSMAYNLAKVVKESVITNKEIKEFAASIGIHMKGYSNDGDDSLELGDEFLAVINYARAHCMPMQWAYNEKGRPGSFSNFEYFYQNYEHWKSLFGYVDFDDMIDLALQSDEVYECGVLMIDEAQDLSKNQWKLLNKISTKNTVVTGDPDQALFKWGGAWPEGMIIWAKDVEAQIVELSQSYRVPMVPYTLSREIISRVKNRYEKDYRPTCEEGSINRYLSVNHYNFYDLDSALILYRSHALRKACEEQLIVAHKSYVALNGAPGLCHNKYGRAIQAWLRITKSEFPDKQDVMLVRNIASPAFQKALKDNDLDVIRSMRGREALSIPAHLISYYARVDFSKMNNIQLSTIHGAKGMESNHVIIINGMTQRVVDGAYSKPDEEYQVWYVAVTRTKGRLDIIDGEGTCLL